MDSNVIAQSRESARQQRNWGILLNVIQYNFGTDALKAFEHFKRVMDSPDAWTQQIEAAWVFFEREIINHK